MRRMESQMPNKAATGAAVGRFFKFQDFWLPPGYLKGSAAEGGGFGVTLPEQRVIPALRITDYERSKAYYVGVLGFVVEWEHRFELHFPVFMSVVRDGMQLYLSQHSGDCQVGGLVHFVIPDVDAWHTEFRERGAAVAEAPNDDLGFRNMTVVDPDGNQLRFMAPASPDAEPGAATSK